MTNSEMIRNMTDEELAAFLADHPIVSEFDASKSLHMDWLLWLSLEADSKPKPKPKAHYPVWEGDFDNYGLCSNQGHGDAEALQGG